MRGAVSFVMIAVVAGCGRRVELVPVAGRLLVDGKPAQEMVVTFVPDGEEAGPVSTGVTGEDGTFELTAGDGRSGAVVGRHRVLVEDLRPFNAPRNDRPAVKPPAPRVDASYGSAEKTKVTAEVTSDGLPITIEVKAEK